MRCRLVDRPIGILYEHPLWFEPRFAEPDEPGAREKLHAGELVFNHGERPIRQPVLLTRMSPLA